jgi:hypothetical protein
MRKFRTVFTAGVLIAIAACSGDPISDPAHKITVQPNPATHEALLEYQRLYPSGDDPTGLRVTFLDLPAVPCVITLFDQSGELVDEVDKNDAETSASWNLMSNVGTQVGTGTYHFAVHLEGGTFIDRGTFFVSF